MSANPAKATPSRPPTAGEGAGYLIEAAAGFSPRGCHFASFETPSRLTSWVASFLIAIVWFMGFADPACGDDRADLQAQYTAAENKLKAGDSSPEVWNLILESLYRLDQPRKALGAARVAAQEYADHPDVVGHIARAYFRGGFPDQAAKLFDKIDLQDPDPVLAFTLSKLLHSEGRVRPALEVATRGLSQAPDDPELLYQAGLLKGWLGNNVEAAHLFQSALEHAAQLKGYPKDLIISRATARSLIYRAAQSKPVNAVLNTGHIPFRLGKNLALPTVEVELNEHHKVNMLLDLGGGSMLSLDTSIARAAGIEILGQGKILDITGGTSDTQWALTNRLTIGDCRLGNVATQVYPFNEDELPDLKGVIGAGLFAKKRMIVDFQKRRVTIEESIPTESAKPSDQLHTPLEVRFLSGDQPIVQVQLKDATVNGIFDIGTPVSCFSTLQMTALQKPSAIRDASFGDIQAKVSTRIPFRIGRRTFAQAHTISLPFIDNQTSSAIGMQVDLLLGWDVFKQMRRFTLDAPARKIIIDWLPPRKPGPPPTKARKKPQNVPPPKSSG